MALRNTSAISHYDDSPTGGVNVHGASPITATSVIRDNLTMGFTRLRVSAFQDQAGSLTIEQSNDKTFAAFRVYSTTAVTANTLATSGDILIYARYVRIRLSNSAGSDTTICELNTTFLA